MDSESVKPEVCVDALLLSRNCCVARMLPREVKLVLEWILCYIILYEMGNSVVWINGSIRNVIVQKVRESIMGIKKIE